VQARFFVPAAEAAPRSGAPPILLGALPFDVDAPAALMVPGTVRRTGALPDWPTGPSGPRAHRRDGPDAEDVS
jgi:isochorismate synthase